ncbi:SNF2 family N-terminal domain-containing protein [Chytriomyces cf. hyalinus JEL632]|nr:SNF2 family N-terminal domain-containing protein [Chytriomyces cf. hyalinus JEL632]
MLPPDLSKWSTVQVSTWVKSLHLEPQMTQRILDAFEANDIDGDALRALTMETLKSECNLPSFGLRKKLMDAIDGERAPMRIEQADTGHAGSTALARIAQDSQRAISGLRTMGEIERQFASSVSFDWAYANLCSAQTPKETSIFNLTPFQASTTARDLDSNEEDTWFLSRKGSSAPISAKHTVRCIQKKIKRMLRNCNWIAFDDESGARQHFEISKDLVGVWKLPTRDTRLENYVRVYRKMGKDRIVDFIDNSGIYSAILNPVGYRENSVTRSHPNFGQTGEYGEDTLLPVYGDSDSEGYDEDPELLEDIREAARKEKSVAKRAEKRASSGPSNHSENVHETIDQRDSEDEMPLIQREQPEPNRNTPAASVDHETRNTVEKLALAQQTQNDVSAGVGETSRGAETTVESLSIRPGQAAVELVATIDSTTASNIEECIELQEKEWNNEVLPHLLKSAHRIYSLRDDAKAKERFVIELDGILQERLPKLKQAVHESCGRNASIKHVEKACENLRMTVYRKTELEWMLSIMNGKNAPEVRPILTVTPKESTPSKIRKSGLEKGVEKTARVPADEVESDDNMSDFIVDDDEPNNQRRVSKKLPKSAALLHNSNLEKDENSDSDFSVMDAMDAESAADLDNFSEPMNIFVENIAKDVQSGYEETDEDIIIEEGFAPVVPPARPEDKNALSRRYVMPKNPVMATPTHVQRNTEQTGGSSKNRTESTRRKDDRTNALGPNFHSRYLKAMRLLEVGLDAFLAQPAFSLQEFHLFQEYSVFRAMAQAAICLESKDIEPAISYDFARLAENLEKEFELWKSRTNGIEDDDSDDHDLVDLNAAHSKKKPSNLKKKRARQDDESSNTSGDDIPLSQIHSRKRDTTVDGSTESSKKGRRNLKPIQAPSQIVQNLHENRRKMEEAANKRAEAQYREAIKSGNKEKVIVNLGHDDTEEHIYVDDFLAMHLKPHQVKGVQFLWKSIIMIKDVKDDGTALHQGCILAHAMGLGKTLQTIVFFYTLQREIRLNNPCIPEHLKTGGVLVVCPAVVLENWVNEITKWIPEKYLNDVLGGVYTFRPDKNRFNQLQTWRDRGGVFVISYSLMRFVLTRKPEEMDENGFYNETGADSAKYSHFLVSPGPGLVVCDESHMIKNPTSGISAFIGGVQSRSRICLTGWPLQNNLEEYFAMIDFVSKGFLGTLQQFRNQYQNPITNGFFADSTEGDKMVSRQRLYVLVNIIDPLLQRLNDDILKKDLPQKNEYVISVRLTPLQEKLYKEYLAHIRGQADVHVNILARFHSLMNVCNHPGVCKLAMATRLTGQESDARNVEIDSMLKVMETETVDDWNDVRLSMKMTLMEQIVDASILVGDKVLIFSRSIPTIEFVKARLGHYKVLVMTGTTQHRQKMIDDFNNPEKGFDVFVISTVAGGIGMNATSANRVILLDLGWNPSGEQQAIARSYRYGQTKNVFVYRLLTFGAFEEKIFINNVHKMKLATQVLDNKNIEKTTIKAEMKQYFVDPPENPPSQLNSNAVYIDDIMKDIATRYAHEIIKIESHEDYVREIEDELTDVQRDKARQALDQEVHRRKHKLKFVDALPEAEGNTVPTTYLSGAEGVAESVEDISSLIQSKFLDVVMEREELEMMGNVLEVLGDEPELNTEALKEARDWSDTELELRAYGDYESDEG